MCVFLKKPSPHQISLKKSLSEPRYLSPFLWMSLKPRFNWICLKKEIKVRQADSRERGELVAMNQGIRPWGCLLPNCAIRDSIKGFSACCQLTTSWPASHLFSLLNKVSLNEYLWSYCFASMWDYIRISEETLLIILNEAGEWGGGSSHPNASLASRTSLIIFCFKKYKLYNMGMNVI